MRDDEREPRVVLTEMAPLLAVLATRSLYAEQPQLWDLGERGRARTLEDFNHHFAALSPLDARAFRGHVDYCEALFTSRAFPLQWLHDAWRVMASTIRDELSAHVAQAALDVLNNATQVEIGHHRDS